jgi:Uma2 family endonuclease
VPVVPDVVLETRSPGDGAREVQDKSDLWLGAGARVVLDLDPQARALRLHRLGAAGAMLGLEDTLALEDLQPGFSAPVRRFFR